MLIEAVVDRFENDMAILEADSRLFDLPRLLLPPETREGDILSISIEIDKDKTEGQRRKISGLIDRLQKKNR